MQLFPEFERHRPSTAAFLRTLARRVESDSSSVSGPPKAIILWGGGKDSTLALAALLAIAELTPLSITAVSMDNPGMSPGTLANIGRIVQRFGIAHEYWHFSTLATAHGQFKSSWRRLYAALYSAIASEPRFMCVACNFCSIVTEYSAIRHHQPLYLATGNPTWELTVFDGWIRSLRSKWSHIPFAPLSGNRSLDFYRSWHAVYSSLIGELFPDSGAPSSLQDAQAHYMFPFPQDEDPAARVTQMGVLDSGPDRYRASDHLPLLEVMGWELPKDIPGGTESDCAFPSVIAHTNIKQHGLAQHLLDLDDANARFAPLAEMSARAREWAVSGRVHVEAAKFFYDLGMNEPTPATTRPAPILPAALASQLFKIR